MSIRIRYYLSPEAMLSESGEELLKSGMFSDVRVESIICPRCPYFNKAFNGHFKDQVPDDIDHIIHFLYTGKISPNLVESRHCDILELAYFFQICSLVKEIISIIDLKLEGMVTRFENAVARLQNVFQQPIDLRMVFNDEEIGYIFRAIETSYTSDLPSYAPLQDLVKDFIVMTGYRIIKHDRFLLTLKNIPDLAVDVVKLLQHAIVVREFPSECRKSGRKIRGESVYSQLGRDTKRCGLAERTLRSICGDCQSTCLSIRSE
ncbi:POZ domain-containing protein [Daldinia decipiens]|uniref:POZ domain-containing protein n=1 Tax=Daldinia decipiens TaxID=326647 RepID=UPI0020C55A19|nr:POZ domain-containing protein [Daldinia decipiens]KAI1652611.1 POZ domain-containing protein [Daldinia decipiens]